jgi:chorismate synthase
LTTDRLEDGDFSDLTPEDAMSKLRLLTAGESHGPCLVALLDGMPAGLPLTAADIDPDLSRRQGRSDGAQPYRGASARMRIEQDQAEILGGVLGGETTGAPIAIRIGNADHARWQGSVVEPLTVPRPGHADLAGAVKYGYDDLRFSLERASARETAARVAAGAVCRKFLAAFGARIGSYVTAIGPVHANIEHQSIAERLDAASRSPLRCPDPVAVRAKASFLDAVMRAGDTAGGVFEVVALDMPPGLGTFAQWDGRISARLAAAIMSIPATAGVEIGRGFESAARAGTVVHAGLGVAEDGTITDAAGDAPGIEGGITTGAPIVLRAAMKPLATTHTARPSVDLGTGAPAETEYQRSDFCAVPRAAVVGEAMVSFVLADALIEKLGGDSMGEMMPRAAALRRRRLDDLPMRKMPRVLWP